MIHTFDQPISGQQEAEIFDPVVVNPEIVIFPWYPAVQQNVVASRQFQYLLEVMWLDSFFFQCSFFFNPFKRN